MELSPSKRRPYRQQPSVKTDCKAYIIIRKRSGDDTVVIEYCWEHSGHNVGMAHNMSTSMVAPAVKNWIKDCVEEGLDWTSIQLLLWVKNDILDKVCA